MQEALELFRKSGLVWKDLPKKQLEDEFEKFKKTAEDQNISPVTLIHRMQGDLKRSEKLRKLGGYTQVIDLEERRIERRQRFIDFMNSEKSLRQSFVERLTVEFLSLTDAVTISEKKEIKTEALGHAKNWLRSDVSFLVLSGSVGCGKTVASFCALRDVAMKSEISLPSNEKYHDYHFRYPYSYAACRAKDLPVYLDPWKQDIEAGAKKHDCYESIFVLDELGCESVDSSRFNGALEEFVHRRSQPWLRTVITTNVPILEIRKRYGDRIADRLNHSGLGIQLKTKSMRKQTGGF